MKKTYEKPELFSEPFDAADVITVSEYDPLASASQQWETEPFHFH